MHLYLFIVYVYRIFYIILNVVHVCRKFLVSSLSFYYYFLRYYKVIYYIDINVVSLVIIISLILLFCICLIWES